MAGLPPAIVKLPPAYSVLPDTASAYTVPWNRELALIPDPGIDQLLPSHRARLLAHAPPAFVKLPPPYSVLPDTASAYT
jgi:hypothetical protein